MSTVLGCINVGNVVSEESLFTCGGGTRGLMLNLPGSAARDMWHGGLVESGLFFCVSFLSLLFEAEAPRRRGRGGQVQYKYLSFFILHRTSTHPHLDHRLAGPCSNLCIPNPKDPMARPHRGWVSSLSVAARFCSPRMMTGGLARLMEDPSLQ